MSKIRFLVMDIDGTLTDGKIYMGQEGEAMKAFDIKDGCGIFLILPELEITPVIITARESRIVENRCREINIRDIYQGTKNKLETLGELIEEKNADLSCVAYVGDDLPDMPCMEAIKNAGGIVMCPADAIPEIKAISDYVSSKKAGEGAIRDCITFLSQVRDRSEIQKKIESVINLIRSGKYEKKTSGLLSDGTLYSIQEYETRKESECIIETHRNHIDIQFVVEGEERLLIYETNTLISTGKYDSVKDIEIWDRGVVTADNILGPGSVIIIYNNKAHKGGVISTVPKRVKKIVCKVSV